jgi:hypothetical protein
MMDDLRKKLEDRINNAPMMGTKGVEKYLWRAKKLAKLDRDLDRYLAAMAEKEAEQRDEAAV